MEEIAKDLKPVIEGIIKYFGKFSLGHMRFIWSQLNKRLMKWVQWEKGLSVMASVKWQKKKYKANPALFPHWALVHP
ncbi:MAG TPA: hypothetical protein DCE81_11370 [Cytophagales bacterium]|nr:hypothetical protein [Cytophagales bacterium]